MAEITIRVEGDEEQTSIELECSDEITVTALFLAQHTLNRFVDYVIK